MSKIKKTLSILRKDGPVIAYQSIRDCLTPIAIRKSAPLYPHLPKVLKRRGFAAEIDGIFVPLANPRLSRGMFWRLKKGGYEKQDAQMIRTYLREDFPAINFGGGSGYTTVLMQQNCAPKTRVIAVEADPANVPLIKQTRRLNDADFELINRAYGVQQDQMAFYSATDFWSSSHHNRDEKDTEKTKVKCITLKKIIESCSLNLPVQIHVDMEGGEHELITEELDVLQSDCALLLVEFHDFTPREPAYYRELLNEKGFERIGSIQNRFAYKNERLSC